MSYQKTPKLFTLNKNQLKPAKPSEILGYASQLFSNSSNGIPVGSKFGSFAHFSTLLITAIDKISLIISKINKMDIRIRKMNKCDITNQINENKADLTFGSNFTLFSANTPAMVQNFS